MEAQAGLARGVRRYGLVFAQPGVTALLATELLARLPQGMATLAVILLLREHGFSYAAAGAVTAVEALALAGTGPVLGRLIDRFGPRRTLPPAAFVAAGGMLAVAAGARAGAPLAAIAAAAAVAGGATPPVGATVRALWGRLLEAPDVRETAYALEAGLQEVFFVTGPLLVAAIAAAAGPAAAVVATAAILVAGTLAFVATGPVRDWHAEPHGRAARGAALRSDGIRTLLLATLCMGAAFGAAEVAMPAFAEDHGSREAGGIALAAYSAGSLLGGLLVASLRPTERFTGRYVVALFALGALILPLAAAPSIVVVSALALLAGMPIAPAFAYAYRLVDRLAERGSVTEAFAWVTTAVVGGVSLGAPAGGAVVGAAGAEAAFVLAAGAGLAAAAVAAARHGTLE